MFSLTFVGKIVINILWRITSTFRSVVPNTNVWKWIHSATTNPNLFERLCFEDGYCVACMQMSEQRLIV